MTITYRELIKQLQDKAVEHGDHVLDLPAIAMCGGEDAFITDVSHHPEEAATAEYAAEREQLLMGTDWM
jgi:hypothetical protein